MRLDHPIEGRFDPCAYGRVRYSSPAVRKVRCGMPHDGGFIVVETGQSIAESVRGPEVQKCDQIVLPAPSTLSPDELPEGLDRLGRRRTRGESHSRLPGQGLILILEEVTQSLILDESRSGGQDPQEEAPGSRRCRGGIQYQTEAGEVRGRKSSQAACQGRLGVHPVPGGEVQLRVGKPGKLRGHREFQEPGELAREWTLLSRGLHQRGDHGESRYRPCFSPGRIGRDSAIRHEQADDEPCPEDAADTRGG